MDRVKALLTIAQGVMAAVVVLCVVAVAVGIIGAIPGERQGANEL